MVMLSKIKNQIEIELKNFIKKIGKLHSLNKISPFLFKHIKEFVLREGKRIRPMLFVIGYKGFAKKVAPGLYTSSLAIELLHDFMLIHDDIIDKSDKRRGKPSMHAIFNKYLSNHKTVKFNGQDLAIVAGDVLYGMAMYAFLAIKEESKRKEKALKKFTEAVIYTGSGEFIELMYGIKTIEEVTKKDIFKIYDYKTAYYTFACPLSSGAILAGAKQNQIDRLFQYGINLGRAFQIKDDLLSIFNNEKTIKKSALADLKEAKKTLLIWHAYRHANKRNQQAIKRIFTKNDVDKTDLLKIRTILISTGTLEYARKKISSLIKKAQASIEKSKMKKRYKKFIKDFTEKLLIP